MWLLFLFVLGGVGGFAALAALLTPHRALALSTIALAAAVLGVCGWILYRRLLRAGLWLLFEGDEPGLNWLVGLGVTTVLLSLAALVWRRRWLLGGSALGLVATIAGCLGYLVTLHGSNIDSLFVADSEGLMREAIDLRRRQVSDPYERYGAALLITAHVLLVWTVLFAGAGVRMRLWRGLPAVSVALPILMIGRMFLVQVLSTRNPFRCVLGGFDPTPIYEQMLAFFAEEALVIPLGGLVASVLAVLAAIRGARAGRVVGDRALAAAGLVFIAGVSLYLVTRSLAEDLARGPGRAFVGGASQVHGGAPRPFGEVAVGWMAPGWIEPPDAVESALIGSSDAVPRLVLEIDATGDNEDPGDAGPVPLGGMAIAINSFHHHNCALLAGGAVRCWGFNSSGQVGVKYNQDVGDNELPTTFSPASLGGSATAIATGYNHSCAILEGQKMRCWGSNSKGQVGLVGAAGAHRRQQEHLQRGPFSLNCHHCDPIGRARPPQATATRVGERARARESCLAPSSMPALSWTG